LGIGAEKGPHDHASLKSPPHPALSLWERIRVREKWWHRTRPLTPTLSQKERGQGFEG
jgi:hypothetical protein